MELESPIHDSRCKPTYEGETILFLISFNLALVAS